MTVPPDPPPAPTTRPTQAAVEALLAEHLPDLFIADRSGPARRAEAARAVCDLFAHADQAESSPAVFAPDGTDSHLCVRVEAYQSIRGRLTAVEALRPTQASLVNGHVRDAVWWSDLRLALSTPPTCAPTPGATS